MKVIFLEHVVNVAKVWEIKEVNDSYARNFLIPKKFARQFTKNDEKILEQKKKKEEKNRQIKIEKKHDIWNELNWKTFKIAINKDSSWKIFWSISEKEIIDLLKKELKLDFTKKDIVMNDWHLKKEWKYDIFIKIWDWETAKIIINVI